MDQHVNRRMKKILLKIDKCLQEAKFYEAHQIYRMLYFRYLEQKKYMELIHLLYNGSLNLLRHKQYNSGADLGILLIDVFKKSETEPSDFYFDKIIDLFSIMSPNSPERDTFIHDAIRWSMRGSTFKTGHPNLHKRLAQVYWNEKNYTSARHHFLYTKDGSGCASMLIELHEHQGYSNEVDLFITQTVLQYLYLANKETANEILTAYIKRHPKIKHGPPFNIPLLNFLFFLLKAVDSGKSIIFTTLCEQYISSLTLESCFLQYLDKIGQIFFNIQSTQNCSRGLFNTFFQSFFNGLDDEEIMEDRRTTGSNVQKTSRNN